MEKKEARNIINSFCLFGWLSLYFTNINHVFYVLILKVLQKATLF